MKIINCTPHEICLNDGQKFEPSGNIARVKTLFSRDFGVESAIGVETFNQEFSDVTGLPEEKPGTLLIVSAIVLSASDRADIVAPATGHPDTIRNEKGHIVSVPGFVR